MIPSDKNIIDAHERIKGYIHRTPIFTSSSINRLVGADFYFKCENFQKAGAFKIRGALNTVLSFGEGEKIKSVATHSSGNHAAALCYAASLKGIKAHIVMPHTAPEIKKRAVEGYGGEIVFSEPTLASRESTAKTVVEKTGALFIHPFNNYRIIEGQATCGKEILEDLDELDYIITPIGGGGLCSGSCLAAKYFSNKTRVIGVEPKEADDAFRSIRDNQIYPSIAPKTIADGLLTSLGPLTFEIIRNNVERILTIGEQTIIDAMKMIWERMKIIVEPSSAVTLAAVLENKELFKNKKICLVLSGGNVDLTKLPWNN